MSERNPLTLENREAVVQQIQERLGQWGVEVVVWDFDSTLIDTTSLFKQAIADASGLLLFGEDWCNIQAQGESEKLEQARGLVEFMNEAIWGLRPEFGVNPAIMRVAVHITAKREGLNLRDQRINLAMERIDNLYGRDVPVVFEGAKEAVALINATGRKSILMTHAEENWTRVKLAGAGFVGAFEQVVCFSVDQPKSGQWGEQFEKLSIKPEELLVIGDNLAADIEPVVVLGARAIWVTNEKLKVFGAEVTKEDVMEKRGLKERIIEVSRVGEVIAAICTKAICSWS